MREGSMPIRAMLVLTVSPLAIAAQETATADPKTDSKPAAKIYLVEPGTKVPLSMINSVSTKSAQPGDRVYLESVFPILVDGRIVIPPGSYVAGTITKIQRPGKVKGRGEFYLRFDTLTLPNGVTRDFRATVSNLDGRASEDLDRKEGSIKSEGNKSGDARTVGETTAAGASIGAIAAGAKGAVLGRGTTVEMVLDRTIQYDETELDFSRAAPRPSAGEGGGPLPSKKSQGS